MLHACNMFVVPQRATHARLTMKSGMARLYAAFITWRHLDRLSFSGWTVQFVETVNAMFGDVFGQSRRRSVAKRRQCIGPAVLLAVVVLGGCAGFGGLSAESSAEAKRDAVAARAQARWDALIKGDLTAAYAYLSPASKATMPLDLYKAKHKVGLYRGVKINDVTCDSDSCTVKLVLTYDYKKFKGVVTPLVENWIITQGQAWFVVRS